MTTGVSTDDFAQIHADMGRVTSYEVATKTTSSFDGDETDTYASATSVTLVFFKEDKRYLFDKEGLLEVGDAYIMAPITQGIARNDKVTIDGQTYYVHSVLRRHVLTVAMVDFGVLYKVAN